MSNNLKELFNEIKGVFKSEGVKVESESTTEETIENTTEELTEETTEETNSTEQKFEDVTLEDGTVCQIEPEVAVGAAVAFAFPLRPSISFLLLRLKSPSIIFTFEGSMGISFSCPRAFLRTTPSIYILSFE